VEEQQAVAAEGRRRGRDCSGGAVAGAQAGGVGGEERQLREAEHRLPRLRHNSGVNASERTQADRASE
jgi:hypothetical protein